MATITADGVSHQLSPMTYNQIVAVSQMTALSEVRKRRAEERKVRTPQGSAPGNARSG